MLHTAKHEGYAAFRKELEDWHEGLKVGKKAAQQLLNYVSEREEMILYPRFQAVGRQIGSGPSESMCKATTQRIKGRGKRWDSDNAEAIMALEALDQSGGWNAYWESFLSLAA